MIDIHRKRNHGFTLIELLIVMGMLGVVMTAVYSLYYAQSKSAAAQDELVEVQQNLRIAMDEISRDIRMSGFLLPLDTTCTAKAISLSPIRVIGNNTGLNAGLGSTDSMTLNSASASGKYARIDQDIVSGNSTVFVVDAPESVDKFTTNDMVRVLRVDMREPSAGIFPITALNRAAGTGTITVTTNPGVIYKRLDFIVATATNPRPDTIQYCVASSTAAGLCPAVAAGCPAGQRCLMKVVNGTSNLLSTNITNLQFRYLLKDNSETDSPDLRQVRAVRVTITGSTVATGVTGVAKQRQMTSIVKMRNEAQVCM